MLLSKGGSHCKTLSLVPESLVYFRKLQHATFPGEKQRFSHLRHLNSNRVSKVKAGRNSISPSPHGSGVEHGGKKVRRDSLDTGKWEGIFLFKIER